MYFQGGDDAALYDINVTNTMGIYGVQDITMGAIKLGSNGPVLHGSGSRLGIGTTTPSSASLTVSGNIWANSLTGSLLGTASYASQAVTASYVLNAVSSSYASTSSFVTLAQTASYVLNAVSASYATSALSSSFTSTASYVANSLITASVSSNTITFTKGDGTTFPITVATGSSGGSSFPYTGSAIISGSLSVTGSVSITSTTTIAGQLNVTGQSVLDGDVIINGGTVWQGKNAMTGVGAPSGSISSYITNSNLTTYTTNKWNGETLDGIAGEDILAGQLCYLEDTGEWFLTDADDFRKCNRLLGVCLKDALHSATSYFLLRGFINTIYSTGGTPGESLYINSGTDEGPGYIAPYPPTNPGQVVRLIGHTHNNATIRFNPDNIWIEL
jgi:hypothetical protein